MNRFIQSDTEWQLKAECKSANPELFFYHEGERGAEKQAREIAAKEVCKRCVVRDECLSFALVNNEIHGIWGGRTEEERKGLTPKQRREIILYGSNFALR